MKYTKKELAVLAVVKKKMLKPEYEGVFVDLVAFTGMKPIDLCYHIWKSGNRVRDEYNLVNPDGALEQELFYRCCREYLFLNAMRPVWDKMVLHFEGKKNQRVLDFAGGMGNDSTWLSRQSYDVVYHEIGIVQREFMNFRVERNRLNLEVFQPYLEGEFSPFAILRPKFDCIILRDVLEHIPNYESFLKMLTKMIEGQGYILEQTPWNGFEKEKNRELYSPLHQKEGKKLSFIFEELGFTNESNGIWKKNA